jgi:protein HOOK3
MKRAEIDRLRAELQKSEDNLAAAESEVEKHTTVVGELNRCASLGASYILTFIFSRKIDELQLQADEAVRLKDQVDEYRHAAEKLSKTENVMEKYKKKLEEGAELRKKVKVYRPPYHPLLAFPDELGRH